MKLLPVLVLGSVGLLTLSACNSLFGTQPQAAPPVIVNNTTTGDSGLTVLLTVVGIGAFLLLAVAIVAGMAWVSERRRRAAAEDAVVALTGRPISQLALVIAHPISTERLQAMAVPALTQGAREGVPR